jgi:4-aminobutyrate aminotransferase-like enzyme
VRPLHILNLLRRFESRNITFIEPDGSWPIVWHRAKGVHVWDLQGRRFLDLTAAFGVAAAGHANTRVIKAGQKQMSRLLHAMSDVHPHAEKAKLARELSRITFERWSAGTKDLISGKTIFCNAGFEAVEAALKTVMLVTGKPEVIAFRGAYHGLGYGALNVTQREHFGSRFQQQIRGFGQFVKFPTSISELDDMEVDIRRLFKQRPIGGILAEPVQGRGGINIPPDDFLPRLRRLCDEFQAVLILDEIYTGFGRTGRWFACEHTGVVPDIICLGKALTGGFPLSACVGRADLMDSAWPPATGDPIHTTTFLGHPVGCAMALAQLKEISRLRLVSHSARVGAYLNKSLAEMNGSSSISVSGRSVGLLGGLEFRLTDGSPATASALRVMKAMLERGFIMLCDGEYANVLTFTPPLTIRERELRDAFKTLREVIEN